MIIGETNNKMEKLNHKLKKHKIMWNLLTSPLVALIIIFSLDFYNKSILPIINEYRDVLVNVNWEQLNSESSSVIMKIDAKKQLKCHYVINSEQGFIKTKNQEKEIWQESKFRFLEDESPGSTKPVSKTNTDFGKWEWETKESCNVSKVKTFVTHICDYTEIITDLGEGELITKIMGKNRTTVIGPFSVNSKMIKNC